MCITKFSTVYRQLEKNYIINQGLLNTWSATRPCVWKIPDASPAAEKTTKISASAPKSDAANAEMITKHSQENTQYSKEKQKSSRSKQKNACPDNGPFENFSE